MIINRSAIWDLHIHTNLCTSSNYSVDTINFVDKIIKLQEKYNDLTMISFTDHNKMSKEVYKEFNSRSTSLVLIPGIEVDVKIPDIEKPKHIIIYFDWKIEEVESLCDLVNGIMAENSVSSSNPISIGFLLNKLISLNFRFLLSPHAFKQGAKGINSDWTSEQFENEPKKFADQFFVFWEASGNSSVAKAEEYLKQINLNERISVISFSDSNSFVKLENYLNNPNCFFNSAPSFRGMQLVGSDHRRISKTLSSIPDDNLSKLIGKVVISGKPISFSYKLNSVIGGRGSGKSILIDKIGSYLRPDIKLKKNRTDYLNRFDMKLYDFNGNEIKDNFNVDYYNQSYVQTIFNSQDRSSELRKYFKREFERIEEIDSTAILLEIKTDFLDNIKKDVVKNDEGNIGDLFKSFIETNVDKISLNLYKKDMDNKQCLDYPNYEKQIAAIKNKSIIPKEIKDNVNVEDAIKAFQRAIIDEVYKYNIELVETSYIKDMLYSKYLTYKNNLSSSTKKKAKAEKLIRRDINSKLDIIKDRVSTILAFAEMEEKYTYTTTRYTDKEHEIKNFKFTKELIIEKPFDYFIRLLKQYLTFNKVSEEEISRKNLKKLIDIYCFDLDDKLIPSKPSSDIDKVLREFDLNVILSNKIYYGEKDIDNESPGTQTNILMEYIVKCDTDIPLIIDQPEDNVDNMTIYDSITSWFYELKKKRQIIVVTHDANIAINADSENVIIAEQYDNNKFNYENGALEYKDNIVKASKILDGGVTAVKRRLDKYGE